MALQLQKAKRSETRIKLSIGGPSGSGKTCSSLLLGYGLIAEAHPTWTPAQCWEKVCIVDTENGSAQLYSNFDVASYHIGEFFTIPLKPPYEATKFMEAIHACEDAGMEVIIIDSLTSYWKGEGGALDKQGKIAARTGNSYTAWRDVTPEYNKLIDCILQSSAHVIMAARSKQEYVQEKNANGKTVIRAVGMGMEFKDNLEYETTLNFALSVPDHTANATKDRTGLFDGKYFTITPDTGKEIYRWLASGAPVKPEPAEAPKLEKATPTAEAPAEPAVTFEMVDEVVKARCAGITPEEKKQVGEEIKAIAGTANYTKVVDPAILAAIYKHFTE